MAIEKKSYGIPAIRPVSALSTARKAAQTWAYLDAPTELLALKLLDAAKAALKAAQAEGRAPEAFTYDLSGEREDIAERAVERFTGLEKGFAFGVDYDASSGIATLTFPRGVLADSSSAKKA